MPCVLGVACEMSDRRWQGKVDRCTLTDNRELTAPAEVIRHFAPPVCSLSDPLRLPRLGVVISCPPTRHHRLELPRLPTKIELARSDNFIHALPIRTQRPVNDLSSLSLLEYADTFCRITLRAMMCQGTRKVNRTWLRELFRPSEHDAGADKHSVIVLIEKKLLFWWRLTAPTLEAYRDTVTAT